MGNNLNDAIEPIAEWTCQRLADAFKDFEDALKMLSEKQMTIMRAKLSKIYLDLLQEEMEWKVLYDTSNIFTRWYCRKKWRKARYARIVFKRKHKL